MAPDLAFQVDGEAGGAGEGHPARGAELPPQRGAGLHHLSLCETARPLLVHSYASGHGSFPRSARPVGWPSRKRSWAWGGHAGCLLFVVQSALWKVDGTNLIIHSARGG